MSESRDALLRIVAERSYMEGDFVLTSGKRSTFYVDVKRTTYDAEGRQLIGAVIADWLAAEGVDIDCVGGMTLGADAIAHAIGSEMFRRGQAVRESTVRKESKGHGRKQRVEGNYQEGDRILVLDDVVTTGGSTVQAIDAYREAGARVVAAVAIVDREQGGAGALAALDVRFHPLFTLHEIQAAKVQTG